MNESSAATRVPASPNSILIDVLFFSVLRERIGASRGSVSLPAGANGKALLDALEASYPAIRSFRPVIRLAVNEAYEREDVELRDGDEVALITPVSGG